MESIIDLVISAFPGLRGFFDTTGVYIWAIPGLLTGLPIWLYGLIGGGFLIWAWKEIGGSSL